MTDQDDGSAQVEEMWRQILIHGHTSGAARVLNWIPSEPRCTVCRTPFGGMGGTVSRIRGRGPSRKSPALCNVCEVVMPQGGAEVDIGVLFADVRGSTALGERMGASEFAKVMNRFYKTASNALLAHHAVIDKMVGDEVMALFLPAVCGPGFRRVAVEAAEHLMGEMGYGATGEPWLPLGVGVQVGPAYVGKVGTEGVNDFTALGDTVNTAARLQAAAKAGEIVMSEEAYAEIAEVHPDLEQRAMTAKGKEDEMHVRVLEPGAASG